MFVVKSPFVVWKQFAGIAEHQEVGVFITVTHVLLLHWFVVVVLLCRSATMHLPVSRENELTRWVKQQEQ